MPNGARPSFGVQARLDSTRLVDIQSQTPLTHRIHEFIQNLFHFRARFANSTMSSAKRRSTKLSRASPRSKPAFPSSVFQEKTVSWQRGGGPLQACAFFFGIVNPSSCSKKVRGKKNKTCFQFFLWMAPIFGGTFARNTCRVNLQPCNASRNIAPDKHTGRVWHTLTLIEHLRFIPVVISSILATYLLQRTFNRAVPERLSVGTTPNKY